VVFRRSGRGRLLPDPPGSLPTEDQAADVAASSGELRDLVEELERLAIGRQLRRARETARTQGERRDEYARDELLGGLLERRPVSVTQTPER
jgi:hypothetical protein